MINTTLLLKLRKSLPHGAISEIAEKLDLNRMTVSHVLSGKWQNTKVISEAIDYVKNCQDSKEKTEREIKKLVA